MISTKADFLRMNAEGRFGNRLRSWNSYCEILDSRYEGLVSIRGRKPGMKTVVTHVPVDDVQFQIGQILYNYPQYREEDFFYTESAPDERLILQGEYIHCQLPDGRLIGPNVLYSSEKTSMRKALANKPISFDGPGCRLLLQAAMSPSSWEDFNILCDEYPNAMIEFGIYDGHLGCLPFRNTIIWEVRNY